VKVEGNYNVYYLAGTVLAMIRDARL